MPARIALFCLTIAGCTTINGELEHPTPAGGYVPAVPVTVAYVPARTLPGRCELTPERLVGCSRYWPGERCEIYVARELTPRLKREVLAHERAHCGGWVHED